MFVFYKKPTCNHPQGSQSRAKKTVGRKRKADEASKKNKMAKVVTSDENAKPNIDPMEMVCSETYRECTLTKANFFTVKNCTDVQQANNKKAGEWEHSISERSPTKVTNCQTFPTAHASRVVYRIGRIATSNGKEDNSSIEPSDKNSDKRVTHHIGRINTKSGDESEYTDTDFSGSLPYTVDVSYMVAFIEYEVNRILNVLHNFRMAVIVNTRMFS